MMKNNLIKWFLSLSRLSKRILMILIDIISIVLVLISSFSLRLGEWFWPQDDIIFLIFAGPLIAIPLFIKLGLYRAIVRYIGFKALWVIVQAVTLFSLSWGVLVLLSGIQGIPRSVIIINWIIGTLIIGGTRVIGRWWFADDKSKKYKQNGSSKNVLVYGAGSAGVQLATALSFSNELNPVAFIDDDDSLINHQIMGLKIFSATNLGNLIKSLEVQEVLLALPSASREKKNAIINSLKSEPVKVRTVPSVTELAQGNLKIDDLFEVKINDLLGRDLVPPNQNYLKSNILNKVVMVTGAGGSIGSEICKQVIKLNPKQIILFEQSEFSLYSIDQELIEMAGPKSKIIITSILGSVFDIKKLEEVCRTFSIQTIYHAAAYKHVPMVEYNNTEGVLNNIFGTLSAVRAAINTNVETFVLISTDKAVRPTNTMGATKRCSEIILQSISENLNQNQTQLMMVRFGNVLDSSGSVIPLFKKQIKDGGPITVTDKKIVRYFMTIKEAVELVIQAGAMGNSGDIFVLDMGEPIRIFDLAVKMIQLSGLEVRDVDNPDGDIEIKFTGLRPGEKLYEELLVEGNVSATKHSLILRAVEDKVDWDELEPILEALEESARESNHSEVRDLLIRIVPQFKPQSKIVDNLYNKN